MKRIVFHHPDGMMQIMGWWGDDAPLPITAENFVARGRKVPFASLVRTTPRAAYYKEPMTPQSYSSFDARQQ
jgi:hypothetical protein